jgi:hypothetical protein
MSKGKGEKIKHALRISCRSHIQETTVCATMIYFRGYEYPYCAPIYFIIKRVQRLLSKLRLFVRIFPVIKVRLHMHGVAIVTEIAANKYKITNKDFSSPMFESLLSLLARMT